MIFYLKYLVVIILTSFIFSQSEEVFFESANPFSFKDIITNIENLDKQTVSGILTIPENAGSQVPLVIGVAGSSGWGEHHFEYLKMYQDMGIATFQLQSFKSRDETSTVGTQNTVTHAMIILDSYRALEKLSENPKININLSSAGVSEPSSFGLFNHHPSPSGWSLGGLAFEIFLLLLFSLALTVLSESFGRCSVSHAGTPMSKITPLTETKIPESNK